jgi:hypothetical protein
MRSALGQIRAVTYAVPDLSVIEETYPRWLRYRIVARGEVPASVAESWDAPAMSGAPFITLAPESGEPTYFRFVRDPLASGWRALVTHGWNVTEIVVSDVDALAASLADSPFRIIGPPASLQRFPMIRAMQVIGPCGECLYFTQVGAGSGLELARAESFVGRIFIVIAGSDDLPALFATYQQFGNEIDPPVATRVRVISLANDLPPDTPHAHGLIKLGHGSLIELDEYPKATRPRALRNGALPPGMAMVSFDVDDLAAADPMGPVADALLPTNGARSAVLRGAAGELIELVERAHG